MNIDELEAGDGRPIWPKDAEAGEADYGPGLVSSQSSEPPNVGKSSLLNRLSSGTLQSSRLWLGPPAMRSKSAVSLGMFR